MAPKYWEQKLIALWIAFPLLSHAFVSPIPPTFRPTRTSFLKMSVSTTRLPSTSSDFLNATLTLQRYDALQQNYIAKNPIGMGGGTSALHFLQQELKEDDRLAIKDALTILSHMAHAERASDSSKGRIILGICAENVPEALLGLKTWVSALDLPRGLLHGMDVDGVPINPEDLGSVYIKYNTGGAMTFSQMRKSGMGLESLWRPGDAVVETYDGDFRGIYYNVELNDGVFRQFGILPTDLFVEPEEDW